MRCNLCINNGVSEPFTVSYSEIGKVIMEEHLRVVHEVGILKIEEYVTHEKENNTDDYSDGSGPGIMQQCA